MTEENKPKVFQWRMPNLNNVVLGRGFDKDTSKTIPAKKKEQWEEPIVGGDVKTKTKEELQSDAAVYAAQENTVDASKHMAEHRAQERAAEAKKPVVGPQSFSHLARQKAGRDPVIIAGTTSAQKPMTSEEFNRTGVAKQVLGRTMQEWAERHKQEGEHKKSEDFLDPRGGAPPGKETK